MAAIIGEAFLRVRPELTAFRGDLRREARSSALSFGKIIGGALGVGLGFGLVHELERTIDTAKEAEVVSKRLTNAVQAQGLSWIENQRHIEETLQAQSRLSSFDDEELADTFTQLLRRVGSVNKALELNALAANVARGSGFQLTTVAKALGRAYDGQVTGLSRLGIAIKKGVSGQQALAQVQERYAGAAATFADTAEGAQARLNKTLDDSREIIGGALLPLITEYSSRFADYLEKANESGELQQRVNRYMEEGERIVHAIGEAFGFARDALEPFIDLVGGLENAIQLAIGAKLVTTAARAVTALVSIGTAFSITSKKVIADAALMGAAIDVATRPRIIPVSVRGGVPVGVGGKGGGKAPQPRGGGKLPPFVIPTALRGYGPAAVAFMVIEAGGAAFRTGAYAEDPRRYPEVQALLSRIEAGGQVTPAEAQVLSKYGGKSISELTSAQLADLNRRLKKIHQPSAGLTTRPEEGTGGPAPVRARPGAAAARPRPTLTPLQTYRLQLADAERRGDLRAARALQAKIVALFKARVQHTKLRGKAYYRFQQELDTEEDKLQAIQDSIAADQASKAAARQAARDKRIQDAQTKQDKADAKIIARLQRGRRPYERRLARAAETPGTRDEITAAQAWRDRLAAEIKVVKTTVQNAKTRGDELARLYGEWDDAIQAISNAKRAHRQAVAAAVTESQAERQESIDKIIQIAELTDSPQALVRALDYAIANAKKALKKAEAAGKGILDATLRLYQLQRRKRDALKQQVQQGQRGTTAFDLLTQFGQAFQGGNLINADQPFVGPSGFVADIAQYMRRMKGGRYTYPSATTGTGGDGAVSAIDRLIAALDRNTNSKNETTATGKGVTAPKIDPRKVGSRGGGRYYEAARARENVETRGGV